MEKANPAYYAVIPANVRYSDVSGNAKLLYGEITALTSKEGYCWASNAYFAKLYNVTADTISDWVNQLKKAGFIDVEIDRDKGNVRTIRVTPIGKIPDTYRENSRDPYRENSRHINTSIITTSNNLPDWLDKDAWESWVKHRTEQKKKLTPQTIKLQLKFLESDVKNHRAIIEQSIQNGWMGLFPLKGTAPKKQPSNVWKSEDRSQLKEFIKKQNEKA